MNPKAPSDLCPSPALKESLDHPPIISSHTLNKMRESLSAKQLKAMNSIDKLLSKGSPLSVKYDEIN